MAHPRVLRPACRSRFRWGPIPGPPEPAAPAEAPNGGVAPEAAATATEAAPAPKRRRKSRWAEAGEASAGGAGAGGAAGDDSRALMLFPGEIVLSNGLKVVLPPALTGRHASGKFSLSHYLFLLPR